MDFSRDQTGFFNQAARRDIVRQAAEDWTYFFAGMNLDLVAAGAEQTFIWNSNGFTGGTYATNAAAYRGFLLYAYGIDQASPPYRSGGEPSFAGGFQASGGERAAAEALGRNGDRDQGQLQHARLVSHDRRQRLVAREQSRQRAERSLFDRASRDRPRADLQSGAHACSAISRPRAR